MHFEPGQPTYAQHLEREVKALKAKRRRNAANRRKVLLIDDPAARIVKKPTKAEQPCTVEGCDRGQHARGLCGMHDKRERRARGLKD